MFVFVSFALPGNVLVCITQLFEIKNFEFEPPTCRRQYKARATSNVFA